jgi:AcrR family transcriptional regulator
MDGMTTVDTGATRSPGRPRSARVDAAIIDAVLDLLAEGQSIETLSIEAVAARAGVGKATIYRRWPGKEALMRDALFTLKPPASVPAGGTVRDQLVALLRGVGHVPDPRLARIMPCLAPQATKSPDNYRLYQEIIEPRRQVMREVLRRGVERGELRDDLDFEVTMALLTGPVLIQKLLRWSPRLDESRLPEQVVDAVLAGIRGPLSE